MTTNIGSSQLTEYHYDSLSNYTTLIATSPPWIGNYHPHIKYEVSVGSNGQKIKELKFRIINSTWQYSSKVEYSYNSNETL